jgi:hypothetical protein
MKRLMVPIVSAGLAVLALGALAGGAWLQEARDSVPAELVAKPYLYEVVRHLYRWYLDENDLDQVIGREDFVFWVRELHPKLDDGDHSRFGEILFPQLTVSVKVKRADYRIPELGAVVKNESFMITSVARGQRPDQRPAECREVKVTYAEMRDDLFRTRSQAKFPEGDLLMRLRLAVRKELLKNAKNEKQEGLVGTQVVHLSPLSPVANEVWVFWETGRALIRFSSDIDLANPAVWEHEELSARVYRVDQQVVVSLDEVAGSNGFLTRNQVGRALYNCIVLGRRVELQPPADESPGQPTRQRTEGASP